MATIVPARFTDNFRAIVDSSGARVPLEDPRVVFIAMDSERAYASRAGQALYAAAGRRHRYSGRTTTETLQYAKQLCSGRECLPFVATTGNMLLDLHTRRTPGEISVYYSLNQEGPCQNGAWPVIWETFVERLATPDVLFPPNAVATDVRRLSRELAERLTVADLVGPLLEEAESALRLVAVDPGAVARFQEEADRLLQGLVGGVPEFESRIPRFVESVAGIPRRASVDGLPKVLLFGGLNLVFVAHPFRDYLLELGVLPKVVDLAEGLSLIVSEPILKHGLSKGVTEPREQFAALDKVDRPIRVATALYSRKVISAMEEVQGRYRALLEPTGLLFERPVPFLELLAQGHRVASCNTFSETTVTAGRYLAAVAQDHYDGLVNVGSFNCQPAMNAQAVLRPHANVNEVPYVALDVDGPTMTGNQRRLLETLAVQAKRRRARKERWP